MKNNKKQTTQSEDYRDQLKKSIIDNLLIEIDYLKSEDNRNPKTGNLEKINANDRAYKICLQRNIKAPCSNLANESDRETLETFCVSWFVGQLQLESLWTKSSPVFTNKVSLHLAFKTEFLPAMIKRGLVEEDKEYKVTHPNAQPKLVCIDTDKKSPTYDQKFPVSLNISTPKTTVEKEAEEVPEIMEGTLDALEEIKITK